MKIERRDEEEIKLAIGILKVSMFKGITNECSNCKHKGHFGSIITYECESGNLYQLCGWCGNIQKQEKEE